MKCKFFDFVSDDCIDFFKIRLQGPVKYKTTRPGGRLTKKCNLPLLGFLNDLGNRIVQKHC